MTPTQQRRKWRLAKRRYVRNLRARLIAQLGGVCVEPGCGSTKYLEFDHIDPREWVAREKWSQARLRIYEREIAAGKIELRCRVCNAKKGQPPAPDDGVPF